MNPRTRGLALALTAAALVAARPAPAAAQEAPADTAAILYDVARQLEDEGRLERARVLYLLIQERYPNTASARSAGDRLAMLATVPAPDEAGGGRTELLVWSTLYGLWLGAAVPAALGAESAEPYGIGLLAGGPTGFLSARSYARDRNVTEGHARAITFGGSWGTWQAFGWRDVFDFGEETLCSGDVCYESGGSTEAVIGSMIAGGLAGIVTGAALANSREIRAGTSKMVNYGALWGTWYGLALGLLADAEGDGLLSAALLGGDAGLLFTAIRAPAWNLSVSRARLISIAGVAGGLAGAGIDLLIQPNDEKVAITIPAITSALGLAFGAAATRDRAPSPGGGGEDGPGGGRPGGRADDGGRGALYGRDTRGARDGRGAAGLGGARGAEYRGYGDAGHEFDAGSGVLLDIRDGRCRWGAPIPVPTLLRAGTRPGRSGPRWEPGLRFQLVQARF